MVEPISDAGAVRAPTHDDLALDLAAEMARPDHTRGSLAELAEAAVRRALHAEEERGRLRAGLDAALAEAGRWKNTWLKAEESESYLKDALQEIAETAQAALGQRE
jgi:hypothetical protein